MTEGKIILVTGGARSGKSGFGEGLLKEMGSEVLYVATAKAFDDEMRERIKKHQQSRPQEWVTYEGYRDFRQHLGGKLHPYRGLILDCVTIMITNLMMELESDWDQISAQRIDEVEKEIFAQIQELVALLKETPLTAVLVTNEVGLGIVPGNPMSRAFRDIAGRMNQYLAREADEVYFTVSGIPMKIK